MDWADTPEQAEFRAEVRDAFVDGIPAYYRERAARGLDSDWGQDRRSGDPEREGAANSWTDALFEHGWFAPHLPKEYGGAGMSPMEQFIFTQERAAAGAPQVGANGLALLAPTLIVHGTEEQKAQYLPGILNGEKLWAQGYSEPGAGSDLAGLQTRATRDGDEWVINGQKIWTSSAHVADSLFALVRTDPDAPKHRGISFVLIEDIHTPGLSVRPLINMGWEHGFNETFFEDVRIPAENVLGDVNRGWYVGMTLLDFERSNIAGAISAKRRLDILTDFLGSEQGEATTRVSAVTRAEIADRYIESDVGFNFSFRIISMQDRGLIPNYEASMTKLFLSEVTQDVARTAVHCFGLYANLWDEDDERSPARAFFTRRYVLDIPGTIAAGSSEIQRNIIATRGLGLPRS